MPRKKIDWDDDGRVCANPECHKAGEKQPWENYHKDRHHSSGHRPRCKTCTAQRTPPDTVGGVTPCKYCGADTYTGKDACDNCEPKMKLFARGTTYVCVDSPDRVWLDGHFDGVDMQEMLLLGYWEQGMLFEEWVDGEFAHARRVEGEIMTEQKLVPEQGHRVKGDSIYLRRVKLPTVYFEGDYDLDRAIERASERLGEQPTVLYVHPDTELEFDTELAVEPAAWIHADRVWALGLEGENDCRD